MRLPKRDLIATGLVAVAAVVYALWLAGSTAPGLSGTRSTGLVILGLGFAASASAVVPGFDELLRGNGMYLAVTSLFGLVAFAAGLVMLVTASDVALAVLAGAMAVLWVTSTVHHMLLAESAVASPHRPLRGMHGPHAAGVA